MSDDLVRQHVRRLLDGRAAEGASRTQRVEELERAGHRIVNGGQTGGYDDDGRCPWRVTDWRTGDVLSEGFGTEEEHAAAMAGLDPDEKWFHIDHVWNEVSLAEPSAVGLPGSLAEALAEWVDSAPAEDVAAWAQLPVDEVRRCLSES